MLEAGDILRATVVIGVVVLGFLVLIGLAGWGIYVLFT